MGYGFVYLLGNASMPDLYKIGCTGGSPHARAAALSSATGVPTDFEVLCYVEVSNYPAVEREIHRRLDHLRSSKNREFFKTKDLREIFPYFEFHPNRIHFADVGLAPELYLQHKGDTVAMYAVSDPYETKV